MLFASVEMLGIKVPVEVPKGVVELRRRTASYHFEAEQSREREGRRLLVILYARQHVSLSCV